MRNSNLYNLNVLIIDDCKFSCEKILFTMQNVGCEVVTADNGEEALKILTEEDSKHFDLIIIDIEMPVMNGFEILREIKKHQLAPNAILCSYSVIISERNYMDMGFQSFIPKPPETNHLIGLLEFVSERKYARSFYNT